MLVPPVIGVDPGSRWTAIVARIGDEVVDGATLGPRDPDGTRNVRALDHMSPEVLLYYLYRVTGQVDRMYDDLTAAGKPPIVAVELPMAPYKRSQIPPRDFMIPWSVAWAIAGRYEGTVFVPPAKLGSRPLDTYPPALVQRRPNHWGPCEARRGDRQHERSAYDVAGTVIAARRRAA